jgi:Flp pilus assembly protein TadG
VKRTAHSNRGTAAVEFALIAPVLFLIVFGIIEFGFILFNQAVITNASREGARRGVVYAIRNDASGVTEARTSATSKSSPFLISLGTPSLPPSCSTNPCAVATNTDGGFTSGDKLTVTIYYNFKSFLLYPVIGQRLLSATTVMAYE